MHTFWWSLLLLPLAAPVGADALPGSGAGSAPSAQLGPLFFDPQGADFTHWIMRFQDQVYRHWRPPSGVRRGNRGHVVLEFIVARDGNLQRLRLVKSAGAKEFRKPAQDALEASSFLPLPDDYPLREVVMQIGFYYNEGPAPLPANRRPR